MKSLLICFTIFLALQSCKTKLIPTSTEPTEIQKTPKETFVLEKEEDFEKIDKDYIIIIKWNYGSRRMNKDCDGSDLEEKYILFRREDKSYIQKVIENAVYYPLGLESNDIINLYIDTYDEIKGEKVYPFSDQDGNTVFAFHRTLVKYIFAAERKRPITIAYHEDAFKEYEHNEKNSSYRYNKSLKLFTIDRSLNAEIDKLNKQNAFILRKYRKE